MNPNSIHEDVNLIPGLPQWVKDLVLPLSCGVGHRQESDPTRLCLWRRLAAETSIGPLAWELPCVASAALGEKKKKVFCAETQPENRRYFKNNYLLPYPITSFKLLFLGTV